MRSASLPLDVPPRVVSAWRSVHTGPITQTFVVNGLWGMHLYRYSADVWLDGLPLRIEPGSAGFTPPGASMSYRFEGVCAHVFTHMGWPADAKPTAELPLVFPTGNRFESLWTRLEEIMGRQGETRANVRAWDVLLELAEIALAPPSEMHQALAKAEAFIESHLAEDISAQDVAEAAFLSHSHLARLFRERRGESIMVAIRRRRVERAKHLLVHTNQPIKEIAMQVGIGDLQRFNKTIRLEIGRSPTAIRRGRAE